jgi:hypothetical protein
MQIVGDDMPQSLRRRSRSNHPWRGCSWTEDSGWLTATTMLMTSFGSNAPPRVCTRVSVPVLTVVLVAGNPTWWPRRINPSSARRVAIHRQPIQRHGLTCQTCLGTYNVCVSMLFFAHCGREAAGAYFSFGALPSLDDSWITSQLVKGVQGQYKILAEAGGHCMTCKPRLKTRDLLGNNVPWYC